MKLDLYGEEYSAKNSKSPYGISAGGVVYRRSGKRYEYLLLGRNSEEGISYHLPKGTLHLGETLEHCALREIAEEAGVVVLLKSYIGGRQAIFDYKGVHYDKVTHYYIAEYVKESDAMDDEHDFREWCAYDDAVIKLRAHIKSEDVLVTRCKEYLAAL